MPNSYGHLLPIQNNLIQKFIIIIQFFNFNFKIVLNNSFYILKNRLGWDLRVFNQNFRDTNQAQPDPRRRITAGDGFYLLN